MFIHKEFFQISRIYFPVDESMNRPPSTNNSCILLYSGCGCFVMYLRCDMALSEIFAAFALKSIDKVNC